MTTIRAVQQQDLDALAALFDAYRQFYQQPSDVAGARRYLAGRVNADARVWVAQQADELVGFTLVYPSWCSVDMLPLWLLYDLFVAPKARSQGVGEQLLAAAVRAARAAGACRLELATGTDNARAQRLYQRCGWQRERDFYRYAFDLNSRQSN